MTGKTERKTPKGLNLKIGDKVQYRGSYAHCYNWIYAKKEGEFGIKLYSDRGTYFDLTTQEVFSIVSRANTTELQVGETYKDNLGTEWTAIYSEGDNVWMKEFDSSAAYVWTKGGKSISINTRYDINLGPVIEEGVTVFGDICVGNEVEILDATVTTKDGVPDWTTLKVKEEGGILI